MTKQELQAKKLALEAEIASLDVKQNSIKVSMNSAFGATSNPGFIFYDLDIGESITMSGRFTIMWLGKSFDDYLNRVIGGPEKKRVIYTDTDSTFIHIKDLLDKFYAGKKRPDRAGVVALVDKLCKTTLNAVSADSATALQKFFGLPINRIVSKREVIADKLLFVGAKNYICRMMDKEGVSYPDGKLKIVGVSIARSDTPVEARAQLRKAVDLILDGTEEDVHQLVLTARQQFENIDLRAIAKPSTAKQISKWDCEDGFKSGTPVHVKAAMNFNRLVKKHNLQGEHTLLVDGAKVRYLYLKTPNPTRMEVIGFVDKLPEEFGLRPYIDYNRIWESCFMNFLEILLKPVGWSSEPKADIESVLFG